jgi:hypothetical protein
VTVAPPKVPPASSVAKDSHPRRLLKDVG